MEKKIKKKTSYIVLKRPKKTFKKKVNKKKLFLGSDFFFLRILELFFSRTRRQSLPLGQFRGGRATQKVDQAKTGARTRP